jgi:hypothetical protein
MLSRRPKVIAAANSVIRTCGDSGAMAIPRFARTEMKRISAMEEVD